MLLRSLEGGFRAGCVIDPGLAVQEPGQVPNDHGKPMLELSCVCLQQSMGCSPYGVERVYLLSLELAFRPLPLGHCERLCL